MISRVPEGDIAAICTQILQLAYVQGGGGQSVIDWGNSMRGRAATRPREIEDDLKIVVPYCGNLTGLGELK